MLNKYAVYFDFSIWKINDMTSKLHKFKYRNFTKFYFIDCKIIKRLLDIKLS